ncbi:hypothetical protein [Cryobacterium sp. TmT3-12]|uniref:hypothetical protein n=1 Tax=Cryobacterium sp. TmT3-12 TaxID=1259266 RepID=UPI00141ADACB|nr:hypothetical protein [Cryobacterium sp. TmT3-12]
MVVQAEQDSVAGVGLSAAVPGDDVVHVASGRWHGAAGDGAAGVAGGDGAALGPEDGH